MRRDRVYELFWWNEVPERLELRDHASAVEFLRSSVDIADLRDALSRDRSRFAVSRLSDSEVMSEIAWLIVSRKLHVIGRPRAGTASGGATEAAPSPPPREPAAAAPQTRETPPRRPAEPSVLPENLDAAAMASTAKEASEHGAGVCEVCTQ